MYRTVILVSSFSASYFFFKYFEINKVAETLATVIVVLFISYIFFNAKINSSKKRVLIAIIGVGIIFTTWVLAAGNKKEPWKPDVLYGRWYSDKDSITIFMKRDSASVEIEGLDETGEYRAQYYKNRIVLVNLKNNLELEYSYSLSNQDKVLVLFEKGDSTKLRKLE